ncbi:unnamed protein product [Rotaria sp. Silwood2]|nr:unnamed protein product [Rotaria sp. Silwood2]
MSIYYPFALLINKLIRYIILFLYDLASTSINKQSSQISSTTLVNNNSNKRRKSNEWVLLKRCRYDLTQNIPPIQSILVNTSTTIDESTATSDDRLDQFLQRFNIHYSDEIDKNTTHLITDNTTSPFVCAFSSKVVHALARHLTVLSIRWIDECLHIVKYVAI